MKERPHLIVVGGFLGAGKTTLILAAAGVLARLGLRSAIILNDQGELLVDTELARANGFETGEVTGGCFCCRFSEFMRVADQLRTNLPDVIFAEPVGSCTDLSATILHPIQQAFSDLFHVAPLTVLVDPGRRRDNADIEFLFQKQMEEADLVCFTKSDLYPGVPDVLHARQLSARTGQGVAAWLDEVMSGRLAVSGKILEIDYGRYAQAEAALAWLNAEADVACDPPISPSMLLGPLLDQVDLKLSEAGIPIVHLKAIDHTASGSVKAALCANGQEPTVEGALDASPARMHHLLVNLRAAFEPDPVRAIVQRALEELPGLSALQLNCFSPAAPKPERRVTGAI